MRVCDVSRTEVSAAAASNRFAIAVIRRSCHAGAMNVTLVGIPFGKKPFGTVMALRSSGLTKYE